MRLRARRSLLFFSLASVLTAASSQANSMMPGAPVEKAPGPKLGGRVDELDKYKGEYRAMPQGRVNISNEAGTNLSQTDAFQTAAEHAVFLQQYQRTWGPYAGNANDPKKVKLMADTAEAIEDCMKGQNCNQTKQDFIIKALSQYNYGQEIKRMALLNRSNAERMKTMEEMEPEKIEQSLNNGARVTAGRRSEVSGIAPVGGTAHEPYFQLDKNLVRKELTADPKEIDRLGPEFLNTYRAFVHQYSGQAGVGDLAARRYRYVQAKQGDAQIYGEYDEHSPQAVRANEVEAEQNNTKIRDIVNDHLARLTAPSTVEVKDGYSIVGERGATAGYFYRPNYTVESAKDKNGKAVDPKMQPHQVVDPQERYEALTDMVNKDIQNAAEDRMAKMGKGDASGASRMPSSAPAAPDKTTVNVSINAEEFDKFLDQIWPSAATRKQLIDLKNQGVIK